MVYYYEPARAHKPKPMTIILLVPSHHLLETVGYRPLVAINTVYEGGYRLVPGCQYTATTLMGQLAPCLNPAIPIQHVGAIMLGNLDLGTVGGALRCRGANCVWANQYASFWNLVAHTEFYGMHRYADICPTHDDVASLQAWRAWERLHRPTCVQDKVHDVTDYIDEARHTLDLILRRADPEMINLGQRLQEAEIAIRERTFRYKNGPVILRQTETPLIYREMMYTPAAETLVSYDTSTQQIILSTARDLGLNCAAIMKSSHLTMNYGGKYLAVSQPGYSWEDAVEFTDAVAISAVRNVHS